AVARIEASQASGALALDSEGKWLAYAAPGGVVRLVEVETGRARSPRGMGMNQIACVAFSPGRATPAVAGRGPGVPARDLGTWQERASLHGHRGGAVFAGFTAKGDMLVTATVTGTTRFWYGKVR